jgi:16S rRNA (guanine966-N2)-methyltransferase
VRIIAGLARGMGLKCPAGRETRPVLDRVKLAWFSVIGSRVSGAAVLDLYSGVGSLGIEALSRGASSCVFVERSRECLAHLKDHLARSRLASLAEVRAETVEAALRLLHAEGRRFDLIFADPPFAMVGESVFSGPGGILERAADLLVEPKGIEAGGMLMLRRECSRLDPPPVAGALVADRRSWGRNEVLFYVRKG